MYIYIYVYIYICIYIYVYIYLMESCLKFKVFVPLKTSKKNQVPCRTSQAPSAEEALVSRYLGESEEHLLSFDRCGESAVVACPWMIDFQIEILRAKKKERQLTLAIDVATILGRFM